jgi:uncharacterized protein (UPF0332 family)
MNDDDATLYLAKAEESLGGAESELVNGRYNNCANRCYYACFQAAVAALIRANVLPTSDDGQWSHGFVEGHFAGQLVNRRKLYPAELRDVLTRNLELRQTADYRPTYVSQVQVSRALRRSRLFVDAIRTQGGEPR